MKIVATERQVREMMALATNASQPMGLGIIHYVGGEHFRQDHFDLEPGTRVAILDYVQGRMVKFMMRRDLASPNVWEFGEARVEYESWVKRYPGGYAELANLVGAATAPEEV